MTKQMERKTSGSVATVRDLLTRMAPQIEAALPKQQGMDAGRFARLAMTVLQNNQKLQNCNPISFISAVVQCAQLGLEPDSTLGLVYLVPFKRNVKLMFGYRGIIRLACRGGDVSDVKGVVVYEKDDFDYAEGTERFIRHRPSLEKDRGERVCAYAVAYYRDGRKPAQVIVPPWKVEEAKRSAQRSGDSDSPWQTHTDAMWAKTAVRRLEPQLQLDPVAQRAFVMDALGDRDQPQFQNLQTPAGVVIDHTAGGEGPTDLSDLTTRLEAGGQAEVSA